MKNMTIDGNNAVAQVSYAFSEVAAIYPITPSSTMSEYADMWASQGKQNLFGQPLRIAELQSEGGAAGAVHGSLSSGALTTTYTASQGLLLMIPNMYKIAGELLPTVFHVSARSLAAHALSIFGDHADVMAARQTGFAMLASSSVQEAMDLATVAHLATLRAKVPFVHFFDGFRTSHEVNKICGLEYDDLKKLIDKDVLADINDFRNRSMSHERPVLKGSAQNPDIYFQNREAANKYYNETPNIVKQMMKKVGDLTGRHYNLFDYYGDKEATDVIVIIGSGAEAVEETIDYLSQQGKKLGLVKVRLFRPFSVADFVDVLPHTVKRIAVMDRTKESGSVGEPLYLDVVSALKEKGRQDISVFGGRYGLGSKEFNPSHINAIFKNLQSPTPKNHFTVGINDDVTNTSLNIDEFVNACPDGNTRCKFYGLGSDGTVGANKNSITIIGEQTDLYAQGYFVYDSKKSGGITISHLRFGKQPIKSTYLIDQADFVACHNPSYVTRYDMISDLKECGTFLLNCGWKQSELDAKLPAHLKQQLAKKSIKFYTINALKIAEEAGIGKYINGVMQAAFFRLSPIIEYSQAEQYMKEAVAKTYAKKGDSVISSNHKAIELAINGLIEIKYDKNKWANSTVGATVVPTTRDKYFSNFIKVIQELNGDSLPVSAFNADGTVPTGTTKYEKRGIASYVPEWQIENCIQCNQCSLVCPHSVIRPVLLTDEQVKKAPKDFVTKPAVGLPGYHYRIQISTLDCTGCSSCANVCPSKEKSLIMKPIETQTKQTANQTYAEKIPFADVSDKIKPETPKGSQFKQSYFEYSGACAGCGETPYIKLVTQLFGDRMIIANATGCSSIYGGSAPTVPYTKNSDGHGPAWANSLFEDNAEYGFGMQLANQTRRETLKEKVTLALENGVSDPLKTLFNEWIVNFDEGETTKRLSTKIKEALPSAIRLAKGELKNILSQIQNCQDMLTKKSIWIFGGDGWAYDIGYGGLDHVIAQGEDVNILILDTEVYSNTGGQSSKSTPLGAIAKFASSGKGTKKKDLGLMAMSYGYVYVAQISMGANMAQTVKAIVEAESYKGPSIIIAYSTCIAHGIDMSNGQLTSKRAVESGYWSLYRYNPTLALDGKNPFILDSKDPTLDYAEFLRMETRYTALENSNPELAQQMFERGKQDSLARIAMYKNLASN